MSEEYLIVGSYTPETGERDAVIDRGYYRQGWIFKDEDAFLHYPDKVCYVPELSDGGYTRQSFMELCNDQEEFARECFYAVDWQCPETWVDEQYTHDEWEYCPHCDRIYDMAGVPCACPVCGWTPDEMGEKHGNTESKCCPAEPGSIQSPP